MTLFFLRITIFIVIHLQYALVCFLFFFLSLARRLLTKINIISTCQKGFIKFFKLERWNILCGMHIYT